MANFCDKCGSTLIKTNGLCPKCDKKEVGRGRLRFIVAGLLFLMAILILTFTFL